MTGVKDQTGFKKNVMEFFVSTTENPIVPKIKHDSTFPNLYSPQNHVNISPKTEYWFILQRKMLIYCLAPTIKTFGGLA
jgi:hypothetical protein